MHFHDDASAEHVTAETVSLLKSAADQIGKADRGYTPEQIAEMRVAVQRLSSTLDQKDRINANRT